MCDGCFIIYVCVCAMTRPTDTMAELEPSNNSSDGTLAGIIVSPVVLDEIVGSLERHGAAVIAYGAVVAVAGAIFIAVCGYRCVSKRRRKTRRVTFENSTNTTTVTSNGDKRSPSLNATKSATTSGILNTAMIEETEAEPMTEAVPQPSAGGMAALNPEGHTPALARSSPGARRALRTSIEIEDESLERRKSTQDEPKSDANSPPSTSAASPRGNTVKSKGSRRSTTTELGSSPNKAAMDSGKASRIGSLADDASAAGTGSTPREQSQGEVQGSLSQGQGRGAGAEGECAAAAATGKDVDPVFIFRPAMPAQNRYQRKKQSRELASAGREESEDELLARTAQAGSSVRDPNESIASLPSIRVRRNRMMVSPPYNCPRQSSSTSAIQSRVKLTRQARVGRGSGRKYIALSMGTPRKRASAGSSVDPTVQSDSDVDPAVKPNSSGDPQARSSGSSENNATKPSSSVDPQARSSSSSDDNATKPKSSVDRQARPSSSSTNYATEPDSILGTPVEPNSSLNTTTGPNFSLNTTAGPNFSLDTTAGPNFSLDTTAGSNFSLDTTAGPISSLDTTAGPKSSRYPPTNVSSSEDKASGSGMEMAVPNASADTASGKKQEHGEDKVQASEKNGASNSSLNGQSSYVSFASSSAQGSGAAVKYEAFSPGGGPGR